MNFNYDRRFANPQFTNKMTEKKAEEDKSKQELLKKEENIKPDVVVPEREKVTASADKAVENYIKAYMFPKTETSPKGVDNEKPVEVTQTGVVQGGVRDGDVQELINEWNENHDNWDNEMKFNKLTAIIDAFDEGDSGVQIWRVRRYTVACNMANEENLIHLRDGDNHYTNISDIYKNHNLSGSGTGSERSIDFNTGTNFVSSGDEEEITKFEFNVACHTANITCLIAQYASNGTPINPTMSSFSLRSAIIQIANNPLNADKPWQDTFNDEFKPKLNKFAAMMTNPDHPVHSLAHKPINVEEPISAVQMVVNELTGLIDELREQGFPYCDELLICIQGYLVYAGYEDIDVLPYPEGGGVQPTVQQAKTAR